TFARGNSSVGSSSDFIFRRRFEAKTAKPSGDFMSRFQTGNQQTIVSPYYPGVPATTGDTALLQQQEQYFTLSQNLIANLRAPNSNSAAPGQSLSLEQAQIALLQIQNSVALLTVASIEAYQPTATTGA